VLVPFLVFAIGVSRHAEDNGIRQDVAQGTHKLIAARYTSAAFSSRPDGAARQRR